MGHILSDMGKKMVSLASVNSNYIWNHFLQFLLPLETVGGWHYSNPPGLSHELSVGVPLPSGDVHAKCVRLI